MSSFQYISAFIFYTEIVKFQSRYEWSNPYEYAKEDKSDRETLYFAYLW